MKKEKDIFDRIMEFPVLRIFNPFYKKNKEILLYLFFWWFNFFSQYHLVCIFEYSDRMECINSEYWFMDFGCFICLCNKQSLGI